MLDIDLLKNARNVMTGMDLCIYDQELAADSTGNGEITATDSLNQIRPKKIIRGRKTGLNKIRNEFQTRGLKVVCDEGEMPEA